MTPRKKPLENIVEKGENPFSIMFSANPITKSDFLSHTYFVFCKCVQTGLVYKSRLVKDSIKSDSVLIHQCYKIIIEPQNR